MTSSPNAISDNNVLNGVSCLSSTSCVAGGYFYDGVEDQGLIATASGGTWALASSPAVTTPTTTTLSSSPDPALVSQAVTYTATVVPPPNGGTVAVTDNGAALAGCSSLVLNERGPGDLHAHLLDRRVACPPGIFLRKRRIFSVDFGI